MGSQVKRRVTGDWGLRRSQPEGKAGNPSCENPGRSGLHSGSATWKTCALERVVSFSEPQFPHLETGVNHDAYLTGLLGGLNWVVHRNAQQALGAAPGGVGW